MPFKEQRDKPLGDNYTGLQLAALPAMVVAYYARGFASTNRSFAFRNRVAFVFGLSTYMYTSIQFYLHNNYILDSKLTMYTAACVTGTFLSVPLGLSGMGSGCVLCMSVNAFVMESLEIVYEMRKRDREAVEKEKEAVEKEKEERKHEKFKKDFEDDASGATEDNTEFPA